MIHEKLTYDFDGLFTFEMANNHQGSVDHGKRIIHEMAEIAREFNLKGAVKLQFRDIDSFIHPDFRERTDNKHIQRFLSTRLTENEFAELIGEIKKEGLIAISTPFDEPSVDLCVKLGVDIIKIGSCSAKDWPLLEKAVAAGKPMIVSVGGLSVKDVDNVVSFLDHRYVSFALMHCVAIYPTPVPKLNLKQIALMRNRYPAVPIGFSSHEDPENTRIIQMAYTHGARLFERHVGVPTENIKLNAYSLKPSQVRAWVTAYGEAVQAQGPDTYRPVDADEEKDLQLLMRGVFAKRALRKGEEITRDDVFFAFPISDGQLTSGRFKNALIADQDYERNAPLSALLGVRTPTKQEIIYRAIHEVKGMLNTARIAIGNEFNVELSHHHGIEKFRKVGAVLIDCVNRDYCKKIIVQLPGQYHPYHHHRKKEETFQVLAGVLDVELEGHHRTLYPGDTLTVQRGVRHSFWSEKGVIFEEISTTHLNDDSVYRDPEIQKLPREERKTKLTNWGRHQFDQ